MSEEMTQATETEELAAQAEVPAPMEASGAGGAADSAKKADAAGADSALQAEAAEAAAEESPSEPEAKGAAAEESPSEPEAKGAAAEESPSEPEAKGAAAEESPSEPEAAGSESAAPAQPAESMEDYKEELESSFRRLSEGDIISGTVIAVSEEEVTLDLKYFAPGIVKAAEISSDPDYNLLDSVKIGDVMEATILRMDDGEGNLLLSRKEANEILAWDKLKQYLEEKTILNVRIKGIVPSGVVAYLEGIRGFIPVSQLSLSYVEDCNPWLGKDVDVRVITVDKSRKKLVMSAKVVARERAEEERNHRISMMVPGTVVEGTVESLMPYGAFVDLGDGLSGLVHVSQIAERRIGKPSDVLKVGQKVKAKLLNTNNNKISLSMRALQEEMSDTQSDNAVSVDKFVSKEKVSTKLGDLLANIKL